MLIRPESDPILMRPLRHPDGDLFNAIGQGQPDRGSPVHNGLIGKFGIVGNDSGGVCHNR
ncbi:MAG TPA: hypothetical protein EYN18_09210 [Nitrospirales bacterium]|nr:hypothetical protein [Nitrospirales bacterium]HIO22550.1 hypothetical protein [Nitrospirales bacterium]